MLANALSIFTHTILIALFIVSSSCRQDSDLIDKRRQIPSLDGVSQPFKIIRSFSATELSEAAAEFSPDYQHNSFEFEVKRKIEKATLEFQQISRAPVIDEFRQGSVGETQVDSFTQKNYGIVDILLVVDNSNSMAEEQEKLSKQLPEPP